MQNLFIFKNGIFWRIWVVRIYRQTGSSEYTDEYKSSEYTDKFVSSEYSDEPACRYIPTTLIRQYILTTYFVGM